MMKNTFRALVDKNLFCIFDLNKVCQNCKYCKDKAPGDNYE